MYNQIFSVFIFSFFIFLSNPALSQNSETHSRQDIDKLHRISWATNYLEEAKFEYETARGEAAANIILNSVRNLQQVPNFDYSTITGSDKEKIDLLVKKINAISIAPPEWNQILNDEALRLTEQDKAMNRFPRFKQ